MMSYSISAVIPLYNEEDYLPKTMQEVCDVLSRNFVDFEILFINDGSKDRSSEILSDFQKKYSCVKVLHNASNQGFAAALKKGITATNKDVIFYIDCDLPCDPSFITRAVSFLNNYDIVIGKRNQWDNLLRKVCSLGYNFIICHLFHLNLYDINIGAKVFKRNVLENVKLESFGSFIDAELLLKAKAQGFSIREIPCVYQKRLYGHSHMCTIKNVLGIIIEMLKYYFCKKDKISAR